MRFHTFPFLFFSSIYNRPCDNLLLPSVFLRQQDGRPADIEDLENIEALTLIECVQPEVCEQRRVQLRRILKEKETGKGAEAESQVRFKQLQQQNKKKKERQKERKRKKENPRTPKIDAAEYRIQRNSTVINELSA